MNNNNESTNEYILFFRGTDWSKGLSPEQIQKVMGQWKAWFDRLTAEGKVKAGQPLEPEGQGCFRKKRTHRRRRPLSPNRRKPWADISWSRKLESLDEAVAIAKGCPGLEFGCAVEDASRCRYVPRCSRNRMAETAARPRRRIKPQLVRSSNCGDASLKDAIENQRRSSSPSPPPGERAGVRGRDNR